MRWPLAAVLVVAMVCATFLTYLVLGYAADGAPSAPRPIVRPGEVFP